MQQIIKERYDAKAVMPRGQQLDKLLARFEAIITEPFRSLSTPEGRSVIRHLNEMRGRHRSVFVIAVEKHRRQLRQLWQNPKEPFNSLAATNNRGWANQPQDWRDCLNTVMGYLTSENAGRALLFAVCHGLLILQGLTFEIEERPDDFVRNGINLENWLEHTDYLLLMDADNADLRKYFSILWDTPHHKGMDHFVAQCASAVTTTGVVFVNRVLTFPSRGVQFQPPASRGGCD